MMTCKLEYWMTVLTLPRTMQFGLVLNSLGKGPLETASIKRDILDGKYSDSAPWHTTSYQILCRFVAISTSHPVSH